MSACPGVQAARQIARTQIRNDSKSICSEHVCFQDHLKHIFCKNDVCLHKILGFLNKFLSMYIQYDWKLIFLDNANLQDHLKLCVRRMSSCVGLQAVRTNGQHAHSKSFEMNLLRQYNLPLPKEYFAWDACCLISFTQTLLTRHLKTSANVVAMRFFQAAGRWSPCLDQCSPCAELKFLSWSY